MKLVSIFVALFWTGAALNVTNTRNGTEPDWREFAKGVNLGGWLLLEDWIFPQTMYEQGIVDEWGVVGNFGGPQNPKAINWFKDHWNTFITKDDLVLIKNFGLTHVRIPVGWWIIDYRLEDGFVDGGMFYLDRLLAWCGELGLKAIIDLHALPGAQVAYQSFTGHSQNKPYFFDDPKKYEQGYAAVLKLAAHVRDYETDSESLRHDVVVGMQLCNEPEEDRWENVQEFYTDIVPDIRKLLPANRYAIYLSIMNHPDEAKWLWGNNTQWLLPSEMNVVYDRHVYHAFGDDDYPPWGGEPRPPWRRDMDSCKTCCRDPIFFVPTDGIPTVIAEWSLTTATIDSQEEKSKDFLQEFWVQQLSLWNNINQGRGYFFWTWKLGPSSKFEYFINFDLKTMVTSGGTGLLPLDKVDTSRLCPGVDLTQCPLYVIPGEVEWKENCDWLNAPTPAPGSCVFHQNQNCYGNDIASAAATTSAACCDLCQARSGCNAFTWDLYNPSGVRQNWCYMKSKCDTLSGSPNAVAGTIV